MWYRENHDKTHPEKCFDLVVQDNLLDGSVLHIHRESTKRSLPEECMLKWTNPGRKWGRKAYRKWARQTKLVGKSLRPIWTIPGMASWTNQVDQDRAECPRGRSASNKTDWPCPRTTLIRDVCALPLSIHLRLLAEPIPGLRIHEWENKTWPLLGL